MPVALDYNCFRSFAMHLAKGIIVSEYAGVFFLEATE